MPLFILNIIGWISEHKRLAATFAAIGILLLAVAYWALCSKSRLEQRIEDRSPILQEEQQGANQAINAAVNANKAVINAQQEVNKVRKDRQNNVNLETANRNRCLAFPESPECK